MVLNSSRRSKSIMRETVYRALQEEFISGTPYKPVTSTFTEHIRLLAEVDGMTKTHALFYLIHLRDSLEKPPADFTRWVHYPIYARPEAIDELIEDLQNGQFPIKPNGASTAKQYLASLPRTTLFRHNSSWPKWGVLTDSVTYQPSSTQESTIRQECTSSSSNAFSMV